MRIVGTSEGQAQKKTDRGQAEQNVVCVFRIKGRRTVDFPGRHLSNSSRHSRRHLRFSILRKRTADTYYAARSLFFLATLPRPHLRVPPLISTSTRVPVPIFGELSHSSCAGPEKSNEALVGSTRTRIALGTRSERDT